MGWHEYQVRSDLAIRRHWALVCCAFAFCWYHLSQRGPAPAPASGEVAGSPAPASVPDPSSCSEAGRGGNGRGAGAGAAPALLAGGATRGAGLAGALDHALALLARLVYRTPTTCAVQVA